MDEWVSRSCDCPQGSFPCIIVRLAQRLCDGFWFILLYFICCALLLSLEHLFLSNERQKGSGFRQEGSWEELGGEEGRKTIIRICCMRTGTISIAEKNKVTC